MRVADCICEGSYFDVTNGTEAPQCTPCPGGTNCAEAGAVLLQLPVLAGYYRAHAASEDTRRCLAPLDHLNHSGCRGGDDVAAQCAEGLEGIYCR